MDSMSSRWASRCGSASGMIRYEGLLSSARVSSSSSSSSCSRIFWLDAEMVVGPVGSSDFVVVAGAKGVVLSPLPFLKMSRAGDRK